MSSLVAEFNGETREPGTQGMGDWIVPYQEEVRRLWQRIQRHTGFLYIYLCEDVAETFFYGPAQVEKMQNLLGLAGLHVVWIESRGAALGKVDEFAQAVIARYGGIKADDKWLAQFSHHHMRAARIEAEESDNPNLSIADEGENAEEAFDEVEQMGITIRRCLRCGGNLLFHREDTKYSIRCEREGCFTWTVYAEAPEMQTFP